MKAAVVLALLAFANVAEGVAEDKPTLKVEGIPDLLTLPLPSGSNRILTALPRGGTARDVWLAPRTDSPARFQFTAVGENEFQVNLATQEAVAFLLSQPADAASMPASQRQFVVGADMGERGVVFSPPITYSIGAVPQDQMRATLYIAGEQPRLIQSPYATTWVRPGSLEEIRVPAGYGETEIALANGEVLTALPIDAGRVVFTPELTRRFAEARAVRIHWPGRVTPFGSWWIEVRPIPAALDLKQGRVEVTVRQRCTQEIPGSRGYLFLEVDDIKRGQTVIRVRTADHLTLAGPLSQERGGHVTLALAEGEYVVHVKQLVNVLVGEDFVTAEILPVAEFEQDRIGTFLRFLERSDITFLRAGVAYTGAEAAAHLRQKCDAAEDPVATFDAFVETIASRSAQTGDPYLIRIAGSGEVMEAAAWIRSQARALRQFDPASGAQDH